MIVGEKDTIAAISTPVGYGGIGVVRISGSESSYIAEKIFRRSLKKEDFRKKANTFGNSIKMVPRRLYHGHVVDPEKETVIDEVLMAYMPSPNSYTCEDVIEIQSHGGLAATTAILEKVLESGARLADPGEFTKRAYLNGRIDLPQAEAVVDVINAKTDASLKIASRNMEGDVGSFSREIKKNLLEIKAVLEAHIDFSEEMDGKIDAEETGKKIFRTILQPIKEIVKRYEQGRLFRDGVRIVIFGKTNVGKSSLLNRFVNRERAIVTEYPGTTRDSLEESIDLFGIPLLLVDTAGCRNTEDPVEKIGIERSRLSAKTADLILFVVDPVAGIDKEDDHLYSLIKEKEKILIINKSDMIQDRKEIETPEKWRFEECQYTSARYGNGVDELKKKIYEKIVGNEKIALMETVPNLRQKNLFVRAQKAVEAACAGLGEEVPLEIIAIDIQEAMEVLGEITGEAVRPDILDEVFSRFCIGK